MPKRAIAVLLILVAALPVAALAQPPAPAPLKWTDETLKREGYATPPKELVDAVMDELEGREMADRHWLAIGGRSYGSFSAVNAMVHTPLLDVQSLTGALLMYHGPGGQKWAVSASLEAEPAAPKLVKLDPAKAGPPREKAGRHRSDWDQVPLLRPQLRSDRKGFSLAYLRGA
jgi:hypothetical protein